MSNERSWEIFFSVGDPSGDIHGANLIRQLRRADPRLRAVGYGGPRMAEAGCELHADLTAMAVMWFLRVLANLHQFWGLYRRAARYFQEHRPDAVVLIDYPGFNWWMARCAKAHGIPVFYYTPPQIWAWAQWRVRKMRRLVDHVLCALPFEADWFRAHGCNATFVGHPFFDDVSEQPLDEALMKRLQSEPGPLVAILPGSRTQEVEHNLHWFLAASEKIARQVPGVRFAVAAFKPHQADYARRAVAERGLPIEVFTGKTPELIRVARCCMAVSGSVSLELLCQTCPTVILYWIRPWAFRMQKYIRKVKYITLVNLLATDELFPEDTTPYDPSQPDADRVLFPEYLTCEDKSDAIAGHIVEWLTDPEKMRDRVERLAELKARVAHGGAARRATEYLLRTLGVGS